MHTLTEEELNHLDSLEPQERDQFRRVLLERKNRPPSETLESLNERLKAELAKPMTESRQERARLKKEIDKKLQAKAETSLSLFINEQIEEQIASGKPIDTKSIREKGVSMGIQGDPAIKINEVVQLRRVLLGGER